jgi:hypothetical protein
LRDSAIGYVLEGVSEQHHAAAQRKKIILMKNTLFLAVLLAGISTLTANTYANEVIMSPKAKEMADATKTVPGTTRDQLDRSIKAGSPKALEFAASIRKTPSTSTSPDLAHAPRPNLSPKDPRYEIVLRQNAARPNGVEIAPLK